MSKKCSIPVTDDKNFKFRIDFIKLPDLIHNQSKSIVNIKIFHLPLSSIEPKHSSVYVERAMLKKNGHLVEFVDLEKEDGEDRQTLGFSIPNALFADPSLAIHLILSNHNGVIIYNNLAHLTENPIQERHEFVDYYAKAVNNIKKNKILSVSQKITQLTAIKFNIEKLLKAPESKSYTDLFENIFHEVDSYCNKVNNINYNREWVAKGMSCAAQTGSIVLYKELEKLEDQFKPKTLQISLSDKIKNVPCFNINDIQLRDFISKKEITEPFAYMEQPSGSLKNSEEMLEFQKQRVITVIKQTDLKMLNVEQYSTSFEQLIGWVNGYFKVPNGGIDLIISAKKKLYPMNQYPYILVEFSEFITKKIGNATHRALALAALTVTYLNETDQDDISIYQSFSYTGKVHAVVLKQRKEKGNEQILLGDPTYNIFENIKSPEGRIKAINDYKELGLGGFLFELCVEKNWKIPDFKEVPMIPELLENEVGEHVEDLVCPISHEFMKDPVFIFSPEAKSDEKKGERPGMIGKYSYERTSIESWLKDSKLDPFKNEVPQEHKVIFDQEKAQTIWGFYLIIARSRPGVFLMAANESDQSLGKMVKQEVIARRQNIKRLIKQKMAQLKKAAKPQQPLNYFIFNNEKLPENNNASSTPGKNSIFTPLPENPFFSNSSLFSDNKSENKYEPLTPGWLSDNKFENQDENLMSRKTVQITLDDTQFKFRIEFTKLPDLAQNHSKSIVNLRIYYQPLSSIESKHQPYVKQVMLKKSSRLVEFIDLKKLEDNNDIQTFGFSISNEWFADPNLAIQLIFSNNNVVILKDLIFPKERVQKNLELAIYYDQAVNNIDKNDILSVSQKLNQLNLIKFNIEKLLIDTKNSMDPQNEKITDRLRNICKKVNDYNDYVNDIRYTQDAILKESSLYDGPKLKDEPTPKLESKINLGKEIKKIPHFNLNDIQLRDFISQEKIIQPFAYMEQHSGSLKNSEEIFEFQKQRIITVIKPIDLEILRQALGQSSISFKDLIPWVYNYFKSSQKKNKNKNKKKLNIDSIINKSKELYPKGLYPYTLVDFSEFIINKISNVTHRALALAILTVAYLKNMDTDNVRIYQSFSYSGRRHAVVLKEHKEENNEEIWLGDPTYNIFENIKSPNGRLNALEAYKKSGLDGFLFELHVEKNWPVDLTEVPMSPELLVNEVKQAELFNFVCPITFAFMAKPFLIVSPSQAKLGMIGKYSYEKASIESWFEQNPGTTTDPFENKLPEDYQLIADNEKAQAIWSFYLRIARSRPGLFLQASGVSPQSLNGEAAIEHVSLCRNHIKTLLHQQIEARSKQAEYKAYYISVFHDKSLLPDHLTSSSSTFGPTRIDCPCPDNPENKMESKNDSSFKISLSAENLEFDFANYQECQYFCSKITPSLIILDKESKSMASIFNGNSKLIFPLRKIGPNLCCVFENLTTVKQILSALNIPADENETEICQPYVQGSLAIKSTLNFRGVLEIPEGSHLLHKGAYLEVWKNKVIKSKLDSQPNVSFGKVRQPTLFGPDSSSRLTVFSNFLNKTKEVLFNNTK